MKKLAIFVEGYTELLFVKQLLIEIAGAHRITVITQFAKGGSSNLPRTYILQNSPATSGHEFYELVTNSQNDDRVKSDIIESHKNLVASGYSKIIGLRDVYPVVDFDKLKVGIKYGLPTAGISPTILFAINEIEAWFLAEHTHFTKVHPLLTTTLIQQQLAIDLVNCDVEQRNHPTEDLDNIYKLAGLGYSNSMEIERTVNSLDYASVYVSVKVRVPSLGLFVDELDDFFV